MKSKVYFTGDISQNGLLKIYDAINHPLKGKIAVKLSSGEPGGHNFLNPQMIKPLVDKLNGTIVECNTAYQGKRNTTSAHWQTLKDHGFLDIAPCDIMDEEGEISLPVNGGFHLSENYVGRNIEKYDSILMLSHFKGHLMAGLGGALKNMSIGIASSHGKIHIHTAGKSTTFDDAFNTKQDDFLESMADADKSVIEFIGRDNIVYINVANNLSVDCDCDSHPAPPEMADIGIFASIDPVAVDKACVDAVYNSKDEGKKALIERMESRHGIRTVEAAAELGLGSLEYEIITV
ncbi:DUF362 domain-containing protein [bacterium]|nr:DUF362 domain-containing protein [bacterium]